MILNAKMRIVAWNIRAGGGSRISDIGDQILRWHADVVTFSEFRGTPPSRSLAQSLFHQGLKFQLTSANSDSPRTNALLIASRWPIRRIKVNVKLNEPHRWLLGEIQSPNPFHIGSMHVPNRVSGKKYIFHKAILNILRRWKDEPALIAGDTNSGIPGLDEQVRVFGHREDAWIRNLEGLGWLDAFRFFHGSQKIYTWYSPNAGNGFRLDQGFVNKKMISRLSGAAYVWGKPENGSERRDALSDHAALIMDFE